MLKIKMFDESHELDLEDEVNEFIEKLSGRILDINYQMALCYNGHDMEYCFSCMILYEENE